MIPDCPPLEVFFLGTGTSTGVPIVSCKCNVCTSNNSLDKRWRSSILIKSKQATILVDAGPDIRMQLLKYDVQHIDAVLFTHAHKDHVGGIDDLRPFTFLHQQSIPMYANADTIEGIRREVPYMFSEYKKYINAADIEFFLIDGKSSFMIKDIPVIPIKIWHAELEILGFRFGDFTYITDCKTIDMEEQEKAKNSKYLVLNAVRQKPHYSHLHLEAAIGLSKSLNSEKTYFTHIGHEMGLHQEVQKNLPHNMYLSYDGLRLEIE